jgi:glycosyltransferase involved in cell wall biosynthesis
MSARKRLLIVNYDFPPAGGAGIKRCLKFMRFLTELKWEIDVLTVHEGNHSIMDSTLLSEVPSQVRIHRTGSLERLFGRKSPASHEAEGRTIQSKRNFDGFLGKVYATYGPYFKIPDSRILWLPQALLRALWLILRKRFDVIFATGPTFTNLLLGAVIKIISRKPLIVDFRDAWLADPMLIKKARTSLLGLHRRLERFTVRMANKVVTTNPFVTRDFQQRYHDMPADKFVTIYNGFDQDDFDNLCDTTQEEEKTFTVVYTGRLYGERMPKSFLQALDLAVKRAPKMRENTRAVFVGSCEEFLDGKRIENYIEEYSLQGLVVLTGHVSRKESLEHQMQASVLLLIIGIVPPEMELTYGLSGKVFDYMLCGRPILAIVNGGSTKEFLEENGIGSVFRHDDVEGMSEYLIRAHEEFVFGKVKQIYNISAYERFNFRWLTKCLSNYLYGAIEEERIRH